jgi:hypothetical protein
VRTVTRLAPSAAIKPVLFIVKCPVCRHAGVARDPPRELVCSACGERALVKQGMAVDEMRRIARSGWAAYEEATHGGPKAPPDLQQQPRAPP